MRRCRRGEPMGRRGARQLSLAWLLVVLAGIGALLVAPTPQAGATPNARSISFGMPYDGKWAWNVPAGGIGGTAHPSIHCSETPSCTADWAVDVYPNPGSPN